MEKNEPTENKENNLEPKTEATKTEDKVENNAEPYSDEVENDGEATEKEDKEKDKAKIDPEIIESEADTESDSDTEAKTETETESDSESKNKIDNISWFKIIKNDFEKGKFPEVDPMSFLPPFPAATAAQVIATLNNIFQSNKDKVAKLAKMTVDNEIAKKEHEFEEIKNGNIDDVDKDKNKILQFIVTDKE